METARLRIVSDGTSSGSLILVDDKILACTAATIKLTANDRVIVNLEVFMDDLDIDFEGTVTVERRPPRENPPDCIGTPDG